MTWELHMDLVNGDEVKRRAVLADEQAVGHDMHR